MEEEPHAETCSRPSDGWTGAEAVDCYICRCCAARCVSSKDSERVRRPSGLTFTRSRTSLAYFVLPPGSPVLRSQLRFAPTYASCIDQPSMRLCFALSAVICFVVMSADCTNNTYDTAPSTSQPTHVRIDDAYATGIALAKERQLTACWCYQ
jgi:hypothetical protein